MKKKISFTPWIGGTGIVIGSKDEIDGYYRNLKKFTYEKGLSFNERVDGDSSKIEIYKRNILLMIADKSKKGKEYQINMNLYPLSDVVFQL